MSADPTHSPGGASGAGGGQGAPAPEEAELRAAYEAELSRLTAVDMMAQAAVSLLNVGARRLGSAGGGAGEGAGGAAERDLEQVRDAIDAAHALLEILARRIPQELGPLRDALSRLQLAYAREVRAAGGGGEPQAQAAQDAEAKAEQGQPAGAAGEPAAAQPKGPGPAEASGRLWVPGR